MSSYFEIPALAQAWRVKGARVVALEKAKSSGPGLSMGTAPSRRSLTRQGAQNRDSTSQSQVTKRLEEIRARGNPLPPLVFHFSVDSPGYIPPSTLIFKA